MRILKSEALNPKAEIIPKPSNPKPKTKPLLAIALHGKPLLVLSI